MMHNTVPPPAYSSAPHVGPQPVVTVQPSPVTFGVVNQQPRSGNWKGIVGTGIIQVILGSLCVILGTVTVTSFRYGSLNLGSPIWCGVFYVLTGILGVVSGCRKSSGVAIGYMIMSILACLSACGVGLFLGLNISFFGYYQRTLYGISITLIILVVAEFVVAIIGASLTCGPVCSSGTPTQTVIQYQTQPHMMVTTQPQDQVQYNIPTGQQQFAFPSQQGQYQQAQAPPTGDPRYREFEK